MTPLFEFDDVVEVLGGPIAVAEITKNASQTAVFNWRKQRRKFPAKHYFVMKGALAEKGYFAAIDLFGFTESVNLRKAA
jgi:hypothetical protein